MTDKNLALVQRYYQEIVDQGKLDVADELFTPSFVSHHNDPVGLPPGPAGVKAFVAQTRAGFSDFRLRVEDIFAEDDLVAARWTMAGTHDGAFFGLQPTGKKVAWEGVAISRVVDGKIVEDWFNFDQLSLLMQLGAIPAPA